MALRQLRYEGDEILRKRNLQKSQKKLMII